jgi:hypothetical protein
MIDATKRNRTMNFGKKKDGHQPSAIISSSEAVPGTGISEDQGSSSVENPVDLHDHDGPERPETGGSDRWHERR